MSFVECDEGYQHFGPFGAAGLLLTNDGLVLLQQRSPWIHLGGTWSIPGGAINRLESPLACAFREAREEMGILPRSVDPLDEHVADCGGWTYTTILAEPIAAIDLKPGWEAQRVAWIQIDEVSAIADLHPAFATSWPDLKELI